jgi:sporulation protein YlmC with PRC-barrel domain
MRLAGTALAAGTIGVFFLLADGGWMRADTGTEGSSKQNDALTRRNKFVEPEHFKHFVGITVENVDGEKIGTIKDLVLERGAGQVRYVIVRAGGFGHRRSVVVPISAIAMTTAKVGIASVDISARQWKKAPEFRKQELASLAEPGRAQSIARFYESGDRSSRVTPTGRNHAQAASLNGNEQLELASEMVGKNVMNRQQKEIGEVRDLLVDFSDKKPALALVAVTHESEADESFAVPIHLLSPSQNGRLQMKADRETFAHAQAFNLENWQASREGQSEIYRWERR